jgi:hypothetical protein
MNNPTKATIARTRMTRLAAVNTSRRTITAPLV